jgi:membrane protease YdiL (CAAX protease family)
MGRPVLAFFALACGLTWALDAPWVLALVRGTPPPPWALALTGLGAFGPALAALVVARATRGPAFGPWRARPAWVLAALLVPGALHLVATALEVLLGGEPAHWFYPPALPEHWAALVIFSLGEELGWRGFAYPRVARWLGPVQGSLLLGAVWGLWHLGMSFDPSTGALMTVKLGAAVVELALFSVIMAWFLERGGGGLWLAIALHAGAHLDNVNRAPDEEVRLRILRLVVVAVAAGLAAWGLSRRGGVSRAS